MRNHTHNTDGGHNGMIWTMVLCCLLFGIFLFGGGIVASSSGYLWPVLTGVFIVAHIWMMFKGHGGHSVHGDSTRTKDTTDTTSSK
jgi:hypothetical protein